ncbi:hypothetical protein [Paraburkholderia acidisoli]|uniref:Uncharacterized protein n=1 Tax=Paraburkholderia acidisoli TaxID=2571748 RepID=A0A7Z2GMJ8_9BURK|nr:hypothetical protein [Paraburkholderia acidisoli]QGZ64438.1 hypothetical protein FAZ98_22230 [Paraburkholderia acidisoli]
MIRPHALTIAAALLALFAVSPAAPAQTGAHPSTLSTARPIPLQKVARTSHTAVQQTAKATKPAPQSLRWLLSETP